MVKVKLNVPRLSARSTAHPKNTSEIIQSGGQPSLKMMSWMSWLKGDWSASEAWQRLGISETGKFSVF